MAWTGKILRVDLNSGECLSEPLNKEWSQQYLGQRGLGTKYLSEEVDPACDPLDPENKLIMATGPLTGTNASTAGRYSVITKSPLTNCIACSNSGGFIGAEIKMAGWDMIIFSGKSSEPVYLYIENDHVELCSASELWGSSVWATDEWLHKHYQDPLLRVACIGRAAEAACLYSAIVNDLHRAAGRSGVGAVMASKNLKAVAVRGTNGVGNIHDAQRFFAEVAKAKEKLIGNYVTGTSLPEFGTQGSMNVMNEIGAVPTRNGRDVQFEGTENISAEAMAKPRGESGKPNLVTNAACFACTIACGRIARIDEAHFSIRNKPEYRHASGGLEYESAWALGSDLGIDDLDALTYANFICNEDGIDPISFGSTLAAAMEMYEEGVLTFKDTGGVELKFGSVEALTSMVELTARGEGFGLELGMGSKRLCEKYGRPDLSMTIKGQEFPAYDPRSIQGMGLAYATSNRGGCHLRAYTPMAEVYGLPEKLDPHVTEGKSKLVKDLQDEAAVIDSSGLCTFTNAAWSFEDMQVQIDSACDGDFSVEKLLRMGERIWNLERTFNLAAGMTAADDTLPKRILKESAPSGPAEGQVNRLAEMLPRYYALRGWTKDGIPTNETLKRLSL
jgi:aldehyde:ferredoxin oxidoreductase